VRRENETLQIKHAYCFLGDVVLIVADLFALFPVDAGDEVGMVPEDAEGVSGTSFDGLSTISMGQQEP
jgi:hypothetical protein